MSLPLEAYCVITHPYTATFYKNCDDDDDDVMEGTEMRGDRDFLYYLNWTINGIFDQYDRLIDVPEDIRNLHSGVQGYQNQVLCSDEHYCVSATLQGDIVTKMILNFIKDIKTNYLPVTQKLYRIDQLLAIVRARENAKCPVPGALYVAPYAYPRVDAMHEFNEYCKAAGSYGILSDEVLKVVRAQCQRSYLPDLEEISRIPTL